MSDPKTLIERLAERILETLWEKIANAPKPLSMNKQTAIVERELTPLAEAIEALRGADAIFAAQGHPNNACHAALAKLDALREGE